MKMVTGPIHIMVLAKNNAIQDLKALMGNKRVSIARKETPYSLRALYGLRGDSATNAVHGSENEEAAAKEIRFFYPQGMNYLAINNIILKSCKDAIHFLLPSPSYNN